jgi:hypothetical protein
MRLFEYAKAVFDDQRLGADVKSDRNEAEKLTNHTRKVNQRKSGTS